MSDEKPMGQVIQIDEARIRDHLGEMVRGTVEETLNAMLDAEADQLCGAGRYERSQARQDTRAGSYERTLQTSAGEVSLEPGMTVSLVARRHGVAPNQLFTWRRLVAQGGPTAAGSGEEVVPASDYRALQSQVRELHRLLGKKTLETEILKEALEHAMGSNKQLRLPPSLPKDGSR